MSAFPRLSTTKIGHHKNAPRVWLEGTYLLRAGFIPAHRIQIHFSKERVEITLAPEGSRVVSGKSRNNQTIPVLDLNSSALSDSFGPVSTLQVFIEPGRIVLTPTQTERLRATRCRNGREGSCFSGGSLLTEAARRAGYDPAFAIEINERYAEVFESNHTGTQMRNMSIEDVPLESLPQVEILSLGIPCQPFSFARRNSKDGRPDRSLPPEAHSLSDMTVWAAMLIRALNPATVLIEQAPSYLTSAAGYMMCHFLERAGYTVEAAVLDPRDYGELSGRKRTVIVAHTAENFAWPETSPCTRTVKDILDKPEDVEHLYFTAADKQWLVDHWATQTAKGNGFAAPQLTEDSKSVPTLTAIEGLAAEIVHFFWDAFSLEKNDDPKPKTLYDFLTACEHFHHEQYPDLGLELRRFCHNLIAEGLLFSVGFDPNQRFPYNEQFLSYSFSRELAVYGSYEFVAFGFPKIRDHFSNSVVKVKLSGGGVGTGFLIDDRRIITAQHCVPLGGLRATHRFGLFCALFLISLGKLKVFCSAPSAPSVLSAPSCTLVVPRFVRIGFQRLSALADQSRSPSLC